MVIKSRNLMPHAKTIIFLPGTIFLLCSCKQVKVYVSLIIKPDLSLFYVIRVHKPIHRYIHTYVYGKQDYFRFGIRKIMPLVETESQSLLPLIRTNDISRLQY